MTAALDAARKAEIEALGKLWDDGPIGAAIRDLLAELRRREAEIEDWRGRLATQCGQTLAMRERAAQVCEDRADFLLAGDPHDPNEMPSRCIGAVLKQRAEMIRELPEPPSDG